VSASERRGSRRVRAKRPVSAHLALEAEILFLSASGMMVRLPFAPEVGSHHGFSLTVNGAALDLEGVVRNAAPQDDECGAYHVGIEFIELTASEEQALEQFVARKLKTL
jgi:hypothetical protein